MQIMTFHIENLQDFMKKQVNKLQDATSKLWDTKPTYGKQLHFYTMKNCIFILNQINKSLTLI